MTSLVPVTHIVVGFPARRPSNHVAPQPGVLVDDAIEKLASSTGDGDSLRLVGPPVEAQ
jgi:hypothetical protein